MPPSTTTTQQEICEHLLLQEVHELTLFFPLLPLLTQSSVNIYYYKKYIS